MTLKNYEIKKICFDLDNVICSTKGNNYKKANQLKKYSYYKWFI